MSMASRYEEINILNKYSQKKLNIDKLYNEQAELLIRKVTYEILKKYNYNFVILKDWKKVVDNKSFLEYIDRVSFFVYKNIFLKELTINWLLKIHYEIIKPLKFEKINRYEIGIFRKHWMVFTWDRWWNKPRRRTLTKPKYIKRNMEKLIQKVNKNNDLDSILDFFIDSLLIIHPFDNGNGRTFHLVLDILLFKNKYFPLFAKKIALHKLNKAYESYNQTLNKANFKWNFISIIKYIYSHYNIT